MAFMNCIKSIMLSVVGVCITICCLPAILPIFTFFYIITTFVRILIKIKYREKATIASGTDVLFGTNGGKSYAVVNVAFRFVGQMNVPIFRSRVLDVIQNSVNHEGQQLYKRFTQTYCQEFGYAVWKDYDNFNVDKHISVINLEDLLKKSLEREMNNPNGPVNSAHVEKLKQLLECNEDIDWNSLMKIILNELGYKTISSEIPQWQIFFLEESNERYTLLYRFNHSIADGVYMTRMLSEGFLESPAELFHSYVPPSRFKSFLLGLISFTLIPFGLWKMVKNKDRNVLHGAKLSDKKRFYLSNSIELEDVRNIKKRSRVGAHSVLFSCLSNALGSHFARRSTTVKDVTAMIPVPRQNLQKPIKSKNKFAILSVKVPTPPRMNTTSNGPLNKGCSSFERLRMIKSVLEDAKGDPSFIAVHSIITTACSILPICISELLLTPSGITIDFSNMPGPQSKNYYGNDRVEEIMFWNPDHDPLGVGISLLSYANKIRVGLFIDEALLEDETEGDLLLQDFTDEVKNILQELDNQQFTVDDHKVENSKFLLQYS